MGCREGACDTKGANAAEAKAQIRINRVVGIGSILNVEGRRLGRSSRWLPTRSRNDPSCYPESRFSSRGSHSPWLPRI